MSTCCPCVEQCFGHPVNVYGSEVRANEPTCQEIFVGWGNSVFRFPSSVRIIFRLLAVSHGFDNHLLRPFVFDFFGGLPCVLFVEPTQFHFHFSASCSEPRVRLQFFFPAVFVFISSTSSISPSRSFPPFEFSPGVVPSVSILFRFSVCLMV